jgi:hypothetical protein
MAKIRKKDILDQIIAHHAYIEKYDENIRAIEKERKKKKKIVDKNNDNHTLKQQLKKLEKDIFFVKNLRFEVFVRLIIYVRNLKSYLANKKSGYGLAQLKSEMDTYLHDCKLRKVTTLASLDKALPKTKRD